MAAHAVVGEGTRAILHGRLVGQVDIDMIQLRPMAASGETQDWQYRQNQCSELLFISQSPFPEPVWSSPSGCRTASG